MNRPIADTADPRRAVSWPIRQALPDPWPRTRVRRPEGSRSGGTLRRPRQRCAAVCRLPLRHRGHRGGRGGGTICRPSDLGADRGRHRRGGRGMRLGLITEVSPRSGSTRYSTSPPTRGSSASSWERGTGPAPHTSTSITCSRVRPATQVARQGHRPWLGGQRAQLLRQPARPGTAGRAHDEVVRKTLRLAGLLGIDRVVMMSGLPGGPGDANPTGSLRSGHLKTWRS